MKIKDLNTFI